MGEWSSSWCVLQKHSSICWLTVAVSFRVVTCRRTFHSSFSACSNYFIVPWITGTLPVLLKIQQNDLDQCLAALRGKISTSLKLADPLNIMLPSICPLLRHCSHTLGLCIEAFLSTSLWDHHCCEYTVLSTLNFGSGKNLLASPAHERESASEKLYKQPRRLA